MAIAERHLAAEFGDDVVDHHTYVLASDGDLMEGISQEAIALAGHLKLNKLIVLFDDNGISIDGPLSLADSVDQVKRFEAAGWAATPHRRPRSGRDRGRDRAGAGSPTGRSLIACRTIIGFGAPTKAGTEKCHGSPLGADEIAGAREKLGWTRCRRSRFPPTSATLWRAAGQRCAGRARRLGRSACTRSPPTSAPSSSGASRGELADGQARRRGARREGEARRRAEGDRDPRRLGNRARSARSPAVPEMIGGSADLTGSNNTKPKGMKVLSAADYAAASSITACASTAWPPP